uniref:Plexin D1 n=1 Tax=Paramormyrops kingsleyae TaxID=1676925 RepID=A0A3B3SNE6_9TELE
MPLRGAVCPEGKMPPSEIIVPCLRVLFLLLSWTLHQRRVGALQIQQAFASPNQTNNFVVDEVSKKVYLAAVNTIYQLNRSLSVEVQRQTGPVNDHFLCHAPQLPQATCEHQTAPTDNFNKLLQLDPDQKVLVVCGSVYQGFCELRKMENISQIAVDFPPQGEKTVFPSMLNIAANHANASTVGLIFRSHGGNSKLLVGATYTGAGSSFFPKNHSKEDLRFENTPEIAIRSLDIKDLNKLFTYDINPSEDNVFKIKQEVKQKNTLNFVHTFIQKSYSYIAINNDANTGHKENQPNSILARICLDTENPRKLSSESRKLTESYIQMFLQCGSNENIYNRVLSVYPAEISVAGMGPEPYLFGVFAKSNKNSAVCAFRFADIEETIRQGRKNCSTSASSGEVRVLDSVIQGSGAVCVQKANIVLQSEQLDCGAAHLQHPLALKMPLVSSPLFETAGLTAVAVDSVHKRTVVLLGSSAGKLWKLNLFQNLTVASQKSLKVAPGESVHHIMTFDPSDRDYIYLMTSNHLLWVKVANCEQYTSCKECLGTGDAYCGWCTLMNRCSTQKECPFQHLPNSWIGVNEGPQQCPWMTITPPEISISTKTEVWPEAGVFHIPIVSGSYTLYDCKKTGLLHPHTACRSCLQNKGKCLWNQQENSCVSSENATKDHLLKVWTLRCFLLLITEKKKSQNLLGFPSTRGAQSQPSPPLFWQLTTMEKTRMFNFTLKLVGLKDKYIDSPRPMTVEVYNCGSGSTDCSQCWGREDQGHYCAWCDNSCRPRDECQTSQTQCPGPEIWKIMPLNGPLEGGTRLTIQGRNLGRRAADVKVDIGGVPCTLLSERYSVSVQLVCVTGRSRDTFANVVTVTVGGSVGQSKEAFSFLVCILVLSMEPRNGSLSGGTKVTLKGEHLDTGSRVRVRVNGTHDCTIIRKDADTIECTMPPAEHTRPDTTVSVCVEFEELPCQNLQNSSYTYERNPIITGIHPQKSYLRYPAHSPHSACTVRSNTIITCSSPASPQSTRATVEFYLNGVPYTGDSPATQMDLEDDEEPYRVHFYMDYLEDPQFFTATKDKFIKHHPGEPLTLIINVSLPEPGQCRPGTAMCVSVPAEPQSHDLCLQVQVGNFRKVIATVQLGGSELAIVVSIVVCSVLLLLCTVALVVYCTKSRRAERYWQKTLLQMEEMEAQIREEIRKGFAELQTDMTDLTKELNRSQGIPFLEYKQFVTRTFFPKVGSPLFHFTMVTVVEQNNETHPLLQDWKPAGTSKPNMEEGVTLFSTLLNNKHFLITFVHALEQQKDFAVRDRCSLASLLTIALHGKLEYYTSIMKDLLVDLIDSSAPKNPKLMLRRTESVVEKMLTNWMSICMYSYLKETVGEPFFLLLCAIKQQINKGSIDAITGKARYTLNEEWLLRENIEAKPQNINVSFQGLGMDSLTVRVMNTDTICQVKEKILEAFYKNLPFSQWPSAEDVDLEWFPSGSTSRILLDLDNTSVMEDGRKKLNTVFHYKIPEGASLAMSLKDRRENTLGRGEVLPHDELTETKKSHRHSHRKKVLPEIYLTRLLSTKGTLQKFLDDLFQAILSIPSDKPPLAVKYFFDFLEEQADKRGISDPDTLHIWKTNSLPLRFWVNILKNPQFVFDIDKTDHMDACLSVIAQAFIDACSVSDLQLGKDSPTNKLLYAKEIPEYKKRVQWYYKQIQEMAPLSEQEMNAHLAEESRKYRNEFNTNLALMEIYNYAKKYRTQVVNALDANPTARRMQLQHKFEQVIALVEDNIYECSSEA